LKRVDILVVGGGPAGAVAARRAAETGARVLLVDQEDGTSGDVRCTGLVSPRTREILGFTETSILREIRRARVYAPGGRVLEIASETTKGLVLDRAVLRRELFEKALEAGVEIRCPARAVGASGGSVRVEAGGGAESIEAPVVIGADGPRSSVASWFDLARPAQFLRASQAVVEGKGARPDGVEVFLGNQVAPGFFAWSVPAEEGRLRVGLAVAKETDPEPFLARLLARRFPGRVIARGGGLIPIGAPALTVGDGVLLVGDAAGQAKPSSGGGIYTGSLCASLAGEIAGYAALTGQVTCQTLEEYDRRWRKALGEELRFGLSLHQARTSLTDEAIDALVLALDEPSVLEVVALEGDLDYPSQLARAFLRRRELWPRFAALLAPLLSRPAPEWLDLLVVPERGPVL